MLESDCDGEANVLVNEDQIYEDMGFKEANEGAAVEELPIPNIPVELEARIKEVAIPVNHRVIIFALV